MGPLEKSGMAQMMLVDEAKVASVNIALLKRQSRVLLETKFVPTSLSSSDSWRKTYDG